MHKIGKVAYKLDLLGACKVHSVFHVSQLKKAERDQEASVTGPPLIAELEIVTRHVDILQIRHNHSKQKEVLVLWDSSDKIEATWED